MSEVEWELARAVLTDIEWVTWAMAEKGISRNAIALTRKVSKGTVNDCISTARRKVEEAMGAEDQHEEGEGRGREAAAA